MKTTRVLLADDHTVVRKALQLLLAQDHRIEIVGDAENGLQAVAMAKRLRPDVVVLDFAMPGLDGPAATRRIVGEAGAKVLVLSCYTDETHVRRSVQSGATGYLAKYCAPGVLVAAIQSVAAGKKIFPARFGIREAASSANAFPAGRDSVALTERQKQVLQLIADGQANKQIAAALAISIKTVQKHRQEVMNKLNIHNTAGLTRFAIESALVPAAAHEVA